MSFQNNPLDPIDRIRLTIGDTDPDYPLVSSQWYQWFLDKGYTENAVALEIARKILALYVHSSAREMEGMVQVYGKERFDSYLKWLKDLVNSGLMSPAIPYAGGISVSDMVDNDSNLDNVRPWRPYNHEDYGF
jgi:hypothetical protein